MRSYCEQPEVNDLNRRSQQNAKIFSYHACHTRTFCIPLSFAVLLCKLTIVSHLNGSSFQNAGRILSKVSFGSASPSAKLARILSSSSVSSGSGSASASPPVPSSPSSAPSPSPLLGEFSASKEQNHSRVLPTKNAF